MRSGDNAGHSLAAMLLKSGLRECPTLCPVGLLSLRG
jgi:hypothetical protein